MWRSERMVFQQLTSQLLVSGNRSDCPPMLQRSRGLLSSKFLEVITSPNNYPIMLLHLAPYGSFEGIEGVEGGIRLAAIAVKGDWLAVR